MSLGKAAIAVSILLVLSGPVTSAESSKLIRISYTKASSESFDPSVNYFIALLELAAIKSQSKFELIAKNLPEIREDRATLLLNQGVIDVFWMSTQKDREETLIPVRIPLYKGLSGWRIMIVRNDNKDIFTKLKDTEDIKKLTAIQGHDWPDTNILRANGYKVHGASTWSGLFPMLEQKRADYFPRSIIEIHQEIEDRKDLDIAIEESIAFHYPSATYFFFAKQNQDIANKIEQGLNIAIADGSFDKIFYEHHQESISKSHLENRSIIHLKNPNMSEQTPLDRKELWYFPNDYK